MSQPIVSFITVNYNGTAHTIALLNSISTHVASPHEVWVVDNGSADPLPSTIEQDYPTVHFIRSDRNLGFAGGNNLAIREAKGAYLFLINNDTILREDPLPPMVSFMEQHQQVGAISPKIRFETANYPIQFAGYTPLSRITLRNKLIGFNEPDCGQYDQPTRSAYAHGAAMMLSRHAVSQVGEMYEGYFLYYEELDWSERIRRSGFEIYYLPTATVYHKESATTGQNSPLRTYYLTRNRLLFAFRNLTGIYRYLSIIYQLSIAISKSQIGFILQRRGDLIRSQHRAVIDFFRLIQR